MQGPSRVAAQPVASRVVLRSIELIIIRILGMVQMSDNFSYEKNEYAEVDTAHLHFYHTMCLRLYTEHTVQVQLI
jgi:hypothetical protein